MLTLFTQEVRSPRDPVTWRAWIDPPTGLVANAGTRIEAVGLLVISIAAHAPTLVKLDTLPPAGTSPAGGSGGTVVISGNGGAA